MSVRGSQGRAFGQSGDPCTVEGTSCGRPSDRGGVDEQPQVFTAEGSPTATRNASVSGRRSDAGRLQGSGGRSGSRSRGRLAGTPRSNQAHDLELVIVVDPQRAVIHGTASVQLNSWTPPVGLSQIPRNPNATAEKCFSSGALAASRTFKEAATEPLLARSMSLRVPRVEGLHADLLPSCLIVELRVRPRERVAGMACARRA